MYKYCFLVFLRESASTAAKRRTNMSTHSGKAITLLDRLAQNLANMCRFIWEWIYAKQIASRDTRGHMGGGLGGQQLKIWGSCQTAGPIGTTFGTRLQIRLGIDIG